MDFTHQIFGSPTSQDYDIIVFVKAIPTIQICKKQCKDSAEQLIVKYGDKPLNVNIAVVTDGIITDCFKGMSDELNNSLFQTYGFHQQAFPNHIRRLMKRNVEPKILRSTRIILSYLSRTPYRTAIKMALKGDLKAKLEVLKTIDFEQNIVFEKGIIVDIYKSIAFQAGQTLALLHGVECFSKQAVIEFMTTQGLDFSPYLQRLSNPNYKDLQQGIFLFITKIELEHEPLFPFNEKNYDSAIFSSVSVQQKP